MPRQHKYTEYCVRQVATTLYVAVPSLALGEVA
jgi:hypothetical protein